MGQPELAASSKFSTLAQRKANLVELDRVISTWTLNHNAADLAVQLQQLGIAAGKSQSSVDLIADGHLWMRDFYHEVTNSDGSTRPIVGPGWKMSRGAAITTGAPRLGEHNAYIFGEILGLSAEEQERLAQAGIAR